LIRRADSTSLPHLAHWFKMAIGLRASRSGAIA
jgi:hypothetical protein